MYYPPFISLLVVAVISIVLGYIWFNDNVFGRSWKQMLGLSDAEMKKGGTQRMILSIFGGFLSAMVMAFVLSYFLKAWGVFDVVGAIEVAFWLWVGFSAPVIFGSVLWEMRPFKLFLISGGYYLVQLILAASILVTLQPFFEMPAMGQDEMPSIEYENE